MTTRSTYDYLTIRRIIQTKVHGRLGNLSHISSGDTGQDTNIERDLINTAARQAMSDVDFRGNIRETVLTPSLLDGQYDYALPTDAKADAIIDLRPQVTDSRDEFETYSLVPPEEFDRRKRTEKGLATILNNGLTRTLRISAEVENVISTVSNLDNINDPDTWEGFGNTDDSDVKTEGSDFVHGSGAVRFADTQLGAGDSIIGIENRNIGVFDISSFLSRGSFFVHGKIDTGDTGLKAINIRLGSDSNNYHTFTDSTQNDCSAFQAGWNLLRADAASRVTTGTPVDTAIDYAAIFWNRDSASHLDTDFGFDQLLAARGKYYRLSYYTRNLWQDTALGLSENATHDSHALLVQNDELELITTKAAELASQYLRDNEDVSYYRDEYTRLKNAYMLKNPSQANVMTTTRYNFVTSGGDINEDT